MRTAPLEIRRSRQEDVPGVLALLRHSLGWPDDVRYEELFAWKHRDNPFGASPAWVALDGDKIVGLRILMRWEFEQAARVARSVRAVDTATHSDYRGRGVFSDLTLRAIDELESEQVAFVFNTPNAQSRPGYLKMGWRIVGRLPLVVRPRSARALGRMMRARTPAERWSAPSEMGMPASEVLAEHDTIARLLSSRARSFRMRTRATPEYLRWRYGSPLVEYRAVLPPEGLETGLVILRVRRRGQAREAVLCEILAADDDAHLRRHLVRQVVRAVDADYVIGIDARVICPEGLVRLPRQGPILAWRGLGQPAMPTLRDWNVTLGDVELF
ncbi:MAG: GNAT family N-acetyltransferase [Acidimicrobiia bacterium]